PECQPEGRGAPADETVLKVLGDLGQLLRSHVYATGNRRERFAGELEESFRVLRTGRDHGVEVAAGDLALQLEQLGRALHRGQFLEIGRQRLVGALRLVDVRLAQVLRAASKDLAAFHDGFDVA